MRQKVCRQNTNFTKMPSGRLNWTRSLIVSLSHWNHPETTNLQTSTEIKKNDLNHWFFVQFSHSVVSDSLQPQRLQHARPPRPSATPRVYSDSCILSQWCHPTISSVVLFSRLQSFPALGSFQMSQFFTSGGQSIGASASASVLPMNIQDGFPLEWTGWISLQSKGLSGVFSNITVQKHQLFIAVYANKVKNWSGSVSGSKSCLFVTLWTIARQAALSIEFSR